jgi:hypothetical protein
VDGVAEGAEVEDPREVAGAFLAVEVVFREEVAIFLQVREVFPEIAGAFLLVAVSLGAAVFLGAVAVVSPEGETVFPAVVAEGFPAVATVFPAGAAPVPLDITVLRRIPRCSPISADRDRVAEERHRVQDEVNRVEAANRSEEALHNYRPGIDPRKFPLAMKALHEHVQVRGHPSAGVGAMLEIFSASLPGSESALRSVAPLRINPVSFPRIVLAKVNGPLLHSNAQIGTRVH